MNSDRFEWRPDTDFVEGYIVDLWDKHDSITAGWYSANPNGTIDGVRISQRWCVANKKQYVPLDQRLCRTLTVEEAKAYLITAVSMLEDT